MIGVGNQAALDYSDYLHVLAEDPRVSAVGLVVEDLVDAVSFSRAAAEALAADKPVVVLKAGASDIGARVAATHSGALVADDEMVQALLDRVGAIRVASLPELDETLKMLTTTRRPQGRRVAVLTNSGGEKALAADAAAGTVLEFAPPSPEVAEDLSAQIPEFAVVTNPFDYNAYFPGAGPDVLAEDNPHLLTKCFRTMIDDGYHVAMMLAGFRTYPDGTVAARDSTLRSWADAVRGTGVSAVMASALPEHMPPVRGRELIENGIAPLQGLREAMLAVHHAIVWEERRRKYAGGHLNTPVNSGAAARGLADLPALAAGRRLVNEADSKTALAAHGLVIPKGRRVAPEEATGASAAIGYPVAIKALEPVIAHKAKAGAVVLNVTDAAQVADAVGSIHTALAAHGTQLVEVLVERMVEEAAHELIAGIKHDPRFGHALVFGRGGSAVEFIEDVEIILLPASEADIQNLVETSSVAAELSEHAIAAVVRALVAVASFVDDRRDEVSALDVNPLIVTAADEVVAVDALLELTDGEESAR